MLRPSSLPWVSYTVTTESGESGSSVAIGTARVLVDGEPIYVVRDAKVGTFRGIAYTDYPAPSANSVGGITDRSAS